MCFSAGASFGAGVILTAIGVATLKKVRSPKHIFFGSIPLIFAIQQISEGCLWVFLKDPAYEPLQKIATYVFLFFAQNVWPTWVPWSIYKVEEDETRKKILKVFLVMGIMVSVYLAYCLLSFDVFAKIEGKHISYKQDYPHGLSRYGAIFYMIATIIPPFYSSAKKMWVLGMMIFISYVITLIFYTDYIVSVWCFFASVISITVFLIILEIKNSYNKIIIPVT